MTEREKPRIRYTSRSIPRLLLIVSAVLLGGMAVWDSGILNRGVDTTSPAPGALPTPTFNPYQIARVPIVTRDENGTPDGGYTLAIVPDSTLPALTPPIYTPSAGR